MCVSAHVFAGAQGGQKKAVEPRDLAVVRGPMVKVGNKDLCRASEVLASSNTATLKDLTENTNVTGVVPANS